jgi:hypothetical protein
VNTKITMTAIGLLAAGVWLLWPSITAPTIVRASHYCIAAHNDAGCSAHATCTCTALEDNSAVVVLDAGNAGLPPSGSSRPACPDSDLSEGPAGPVDPPPPHENCKPHVPHEPARRKTRTGKTLAPQKRAARHE